MLFRLPLKAYSYNLPLPALWEAKAGCMSRGLTALRSGRGRDKKY